MKSLFRKIHNFFFCLRYPFYKSRNVWSDKFLGYSCTWYDAIPEGWRIAFGKQLSKELRAALKKDKLLRTFRFMDIKEKWGELCLYNNGVRDNTDRVITKYEKLSTAYCINCGKPVRYITQGYILYICEDCANKKILGKRPESRRLTIDDVPETYVYTKGHEERRVDYKEEYGLDFIKLWGLNEEEKK